MKNKLLFIAGLLFFISSCSLFSPAQNNAVLSFVVDGDMAREVQKSLGAMTSLPLSARYLEGENAFLEISIFGDYSDSKTIALVDGESLSFTNLSEGLKVYAQGSIYVNVQSEDGKESRKELYTGKSESFVLKRGINDLELTLYKVKAETEENPETVEPEEPEESEPTEPEEVEEPDPEEPEEPDPEDPEEPETPEEPEVITVEYKVLHLKQNIDDDEYSLVEEDSQTLSGQTGSLTEAKAKEYEGFTSVEFEQKELAKTDNDISIKYKRNVHKLFYVDPGVLTIDTVEEDTEPVILLEESYRYGAEVKLKFDIVEGLEGHENSNFIGWYTEDKVIHTSVLENSIIMGDEDIYLVGLWTEAELPEETATISLTLNQNELSDISVEVKADATEVSGNDLILAGASSELVFEADSSYDSYVWKINGEEVTASSEIASVNGNKLTITMAQTASSFIYDITLLASKTDSASGEVLYHSYSAQIKKN